MLGPENIRTFGTTLIENDGPPRLLATFGEGALRACDPERLELGATSADGIAAIHARVVPVIQAEGGTPQTLPCRRIRRDRPNARPHYFGVALRTLVKINP